MKKRSRATEKSVESRKKGQILANGAATVGGEH